MPRRSQRRKLAVASWRPSRDGRIYTRLEIDASPLLAYAARLSADSGVRVTPTHLVGRAVALGMREVPAFNGRVLLGRVVPHEEVHVGFAVDVADGDDLAPVTVRAADTKRTVVLAAEIAERVRRVRARADRDFAVSNRLVHLAPRIALRPLLGFASLWNGGLGRRALGQPGFPLGAAFVSSVGSIGIDEGFLAPVPFARCSLYVSVGAVRERPWVEDGELVVRPVMVLAATADHRIVDGAHAGTLSRFIREMLADPARMDAVDASASTAPSPSPSPSSASAASASPAPASSAAPMPTPAPTSSAAPTPASASSAAPTPASSAPPPGEASPVVVRSARETTSDPAAARTADPVLAARPPRGA